MTQIEIKDYLENYHEKKAVAEYKKRQGLVYDRTLVCVTAIEECVAGMPSEMGEILKLHYFQRISLREMSKKYYLGRNDSQKKRQGNYHYKRLFIRGLKIGTEQSHFEPK